MSKSHTSVPPSFASYKRNAWFSTFNDVCIYKLQFHQFCLYVMFIQNLKINLIIFRHNTHHYLQFFIAIRDSIKNGTFNQLQKKIRLKYISLNSEFPPLQQSNCISIE